MYKQITNKNGEKLYLFTLVLTNNIKPYIRVNTWAKCKEQLERATVETDNDRFFAQLVHKEVDEEFHKAEASMRCNEKDCDNNFFKYITIEPLYTEAW